MQIEQGEWLVGIARAFDERSGNLIVADHDVLTLSPLGDVAVAIDALLDRTLAAQSSSQTS